MEANLSAELDDLSGWGSPVNGRASNKASDSFIIAAAAAIFSLEGSPAWRSPVSTPFFFKVSATCKCCIGAAFFAWAAVQ